MRDPEYVINRHCDAVCKRSEILSAEYMFIAPNAAHNWLIVYLRDGRKLESELLKNEPTLLRLMTRMHCDGVRIYKTQCHQVVDDVVG